MNVLRWHLERRRAEGELPLADGARLDEAVQRSGPTMMDARMFDEYRAQVVALRRIGERFVACVQTLEATDLADDADIARWVHELESAAAAGGDAVRMAIELQARIVDAWPRPLVETPE